MQRNTLLDFRKEKILHILFSNFCWVVLYFFFLTKPRGLGPKREPILHTHGKIACINRDKARTSRKR